MTPNNDCRSVCNCSCHYSIQGDWREEFDRKFSDLSHVGCENSLPCSTVKTDVKSFISSVEKKAVEGERNRLQKVAQEYKDKGFELETFIYSGFIPDLFPPLPIVKNK